MRVRTAKSEGVVLDLTFDREDQCVRRPSGFERDSLLCGHCGQEGVESRGKAPNLVVNLCPPSAMGVRSVVTQR